MTEASIRKVRGAPLNGKLYEVLLSLPLLQFSRADADEQTAVRDFVRDAMGDAFSEEGFSSVAGEMSRDSSLDPDTRVLRCTGFISYMDYTELRILAGFWDSFLGRHPLMRYQAHRLAVHGAKVLGVSSTVHITQRSYPNLFCLIGSIERFNAVLDRLQMLRSQVSDMIREETGTPQPIWEVLMQLAILHCAHSHLRDEDGGVYGVIIRFARKNLPNLSFQQVMRLCDNLSSLILAEQGLHMLFIHQIDQHLDFGAKEALLTRLLEMKALCRNGVAKFFSYYAEAAVVAAKFSEDDLGRMIFCLNGEHSGLPAHFTVHRIDKGPLRFSCRGGVVVPASEGLEPCLVVSLKDEKTFRMEFSGAAGAGSLEYGENDEQYVGRSCMIFRPGIRAVCCYPFREPSLHVSDLGVVFRGHRILDKVSFSARSGEMIAVIGPSGCGKSTLLTLLSGMLGPTAGEISFDRRRVAGVDGLSAISTYIPQDDILFRELTVREAIGYSVRLKVRGDRAGHEGRISRAVEVLGLGAACPLKIGDEGEKGISGGQRKRVNIGTTIVAEMKPILLFDEPTSGLDPATDIEIMQLIRSLSRRGHIVLCVTHNLSEESIRFFDKILVLGEGGRVSFFGKRQRLLYFFSIGGPQVLFQKMKDSAGVDYNRKFLNTPESASLTREMEREKNLRERRLDPEAPESAKMASAPGWASNLVTFFGREMRRKTRDRQFLGMCLLQPAVIALFICWNFVAPLPNGIFSIITAVLWIGAISSVREINGEWPQLKRDYLHGTSLGAYFISKLAAGFSFSAFQVAALLSLVALSGGYLSEPFAFSFPSMMAVLLILNLFGVSLGMFLSASVRSTLAAVGILPVILIPLVIMGGALISHNSAAKWQGRAMMLNPLRIAYEATIFSAKNILRPGLSRLDSRKAGEADGQERLWNEYQEKKRLYDADREAYRSKYGGGKDINSLFSDLLSGKQSAELPPPAAPIEVVCPELLLPRRDLWLMGYLLLPVDRPEGVGLFSAPKPLYWAKYEVSAPKAFVERISAQGALGMYAETGEKDGKKTVSVYAPAGYLLIALAEIFAVAILTYLVLRAKLAKKFA